MKFGSTIRKLRKAKKLTLSDVSRESGIQMATLSRLENNKMAGTLSCHIELALPMETVKEQDVQPGDLAYMKADGLVGHAIAFFEGGAFSHVKILTDKNEWVSATPGRGVSTYPKQAYDNRQTRIISKFRGNQNVINAAKAQTVARPPLTYNYVFGGRGRVCSTTCGNAISVGAGIPWTGIGPNSQYQIFKSYGE